MIRRIENKLMVYTTLEKVQKIIDDTFYNVFNKSNNKTFIIETFGGNKTTFKKSNISIYKVCEYIEGYMYLRFMDINGKWESINIKDIKHIIDGRKNIVFNYGQLPKVEIKEVVIKEGKKVSNTNFNKIYIAIVDGEESKEYKGIGVQGKYIEKLYIPNDFIQDNKINVLLSNEESAIKENTNNKGVNNMDNLNLITNLVKDYNVGIKSWVDCATKYKFEGNFEEFINYLNNDYELYYINNDNSITKVPKNDNGFYVAFKLVENDDNFKLVSSDNKIISTLSIEKYFDGKNFYMNLDTAESFENDNINMNIQLLASKKESKINIIKQLENAIDNLNKALNLLNDIDLPSMYKNSDLKNISNFINEYKEKNNIQDDYFCIYDVLDNSIVQNIENIKNVIESDTKDLYKKELNNHKNDNIKPLRDKDDNNNIISLSILNDDRKIIKSSLDKVYNIIDKDTKVDICIFDLNLQLRVLNEFIKDNKKIDKNKLIDDFSAILNNIEKSIDIFKDNKRRLKTFKKMYEDISDILDYNILGFKKVF